MDISVHREKGLFKSAYGACLPLSIFFDARLVGQVATGTTEVLVLPDRAGLLQMGFDTMTKGMEVMPCGNLQAFKVRTRGWVLFDFINLVYVRPFSRWVFSVERVL
ncbi:MULTISPECIES: hypothetical protein [Pseudomonas syringae group]|uniref:Uncharacterized protein n=1 Tax=Pseudomonas syringae pv. primulae TaxID=251707 RepID=A0A0P9Y9F5_9PSED|nr:MULTISPECIES: hypothetical protein [Pseudomonas syringae group]KPY41617.1 Unknown protein sequence [Pseudomonas syringae pv. primulae]MBD8188537.1 hypothetical protein [Pseudomonas viridiflava]MBD8202702.1 hypothetical protein [Pseudomonas viridiflava]TKJ67070.1 hypothetical protein PviCFBP13507_08730 [Pseudomonas viridiflava]TKK29336.1 hypothetical protein PviCFBP13515_08720 [Pseudomonas viridiflava]